MRLPNFARNFVNPDFAFFFAGTIMTSSVPQTLDHDSGGSGTCWKWHNTEMDRQKLLQSDPGPFLTAVKISDNGSCDYGHTLVRSEEGNLSSMTA